MKMFSQKCPIRNEFLQWSTNSFRSQRSVVVIGIADWPLHLAAESRFLDIIFRLALFCLLLRPPTSNRPFLSRFLSLRPPLPLLPFLFSSMSTLGLLTAGVATLTFGSFAAPVKSRAARSVDIHPLAFQTYKTLACVLTSPLSLLFLPDRTVVFTPLGLLSGLFWVPGGVAAIYAGLYVFFVQQLCS